jgi:hypothetical protein
MGGSWLNAELAERLEAGKLTLAEANALGCEKLARGTGES